MPIPSVTEVEEFKEDIDDAEAIVNGFSTVTTRLGGNKESLSQLLANVTHGTISAYNAGTTYTDVDTWVEEGGVVYRPLPSELPIGPEAFDATHWVAAQDVGGVNKVESIASLIATSTNADMVYVQGYFTGWTSTPGGPKGGHFRHKTGGTNTAPTVGTAVAVSSVGGGSGGGTTTGQSAQAGYCWDASGAEWYISVGDWLNPMSLGALGDGATDDAAAWRDVFQVAEDSGCNSILSPAGLVYYLESRVTKTVTSVTLDMGGSSFFINYTEQGNPVIDIDVSDFCKIMNLTVDGNDTSHRPFALTGLNTSVKIITENVTVKNVFGIPTGGLAVIGVYITGFGESVHMTNTRVENVDSSASRSNTAGILVGRSTDSDHNFYNVTIINTHLKNITEQGGTTITDSDGIKVFGAISQSNYSSRRTNCVINGVHIENSTGLNLKRVIKTQVSQYDIRNVTGKFSNTDVNVFIDNQYGSGSVNNVDLQLDTVVISTGLVNNPQFADGDTLNNSGCTIENISAMGVGCTATTLTQSFYSNSNRRTTRSFKNWYVKGFTYDNFGVIEHDNNDQFLDFQNINLRDSTISEDYALLGTGSSAGRTYAEVSFVNFQTDRMVGAIGLYSGDGSVWGRILPVQVVNTSLYFMGNDGEVGRYMKYGRWENGVYRYCAKTVAQKAGGIGSTIVTIYNDLASWNYEMLKFNFKTKQNTNISNSEFTVYFDSATTTTTAEVVESHTATTLLATPAASYNSGTGELTLSFSTDVTSNQQAVLEITSTVEFEVNTVFGVAL